MTKSQILTVLFLILHSRSLSQEIKHRTTSDFYVSQKNDTIFTNTYEITNGTASDLILWIETSQIKLWKNKRNYFSFHRGDYSLIEELNEETVGYKRFDIIGESFLKNISPGRHFVMTLLFNNRNIWEKYKTISVFATVSKQEVSKSIWSTLQRNKKLFYQSMYIALSNTLLD